MKNKSGQSDESVNDKQVKPANQTDSIISFINDKYGDSIHQVNEESNEVVEANEALNKEVNERQVIIGSAHNAQQLLEAIQLTPTPWYYSLLLGLVAPFYRLKVSQNSKKSADYTKEIADRFGKRYLVKPLSWSKDFSEELLSPTSPIIWCHAVSLGETNTIAPVLERLLAVGCRIWMTNTTHTGYQRTVQRFAKEIDEGQLQHGYVPIDKANVMEDFLDYVKPNLAIFVETELWGNALYQLSKRYIPSVLINARLSEKSFLGYHKFGQLSESMMKNIGLIIAQDADSARRFRELGADSSKIRVAGSLKWTVNIPLKSDGENAQQDISNSLTEMEKSLILSNGSVLKPTNSEKSIQKQEIIKPPSHKMASKTPKTEDVKLEAVTNPQTKKVKSNKYATKKKTNLAIDTVTETPITIKQVKQPNLVSLTSDNIKGKVAQAINHRPVWVVASTHEGEEVVALSAQRKLIQLATFSDTLLIVVPRHPERFDSVAKQIAVSGLRYCRRSKDELPADDTQVYLADSMSELSVWYELADVAFVGGSMVNVGGHNPIEALAMATPVIMGKYTQSCQMIVDELKHAEVLQQLTNEYQLKKRGKNVKALDEEQISQLSESLYQAVKLWLNNPERTAELGEKGKQLVLDKQSIINRQLQVILDLLF